MKRPIVLSIALAALVATGHAVAQSADANRPTPLSFSEFFDASSRALAPSRKLLELTGRRVRITGYMARMEQPPSGAFYLVPTPVANDESGGGTGDLPPSAVRVVVRSKAGQAVGFIPVPLEVTGVLEIGYREEPDGSTSRIRLVLDSDKDLAAPAAPTERSNQ